MAKLKVERGEIKETVIQERIVTGAEQNAEDGLNRTDGGPRDIFEYVATIPAENYSDFICYIYREAPDAVKGHVGKITVPFDEETIRDLVGGGTYKLMLKMGSELRRRQIFTIAGAPKTDVLMPAAAVALPGVAANKSDIQAIVEMVLRATPGAAGAELTKTAFLNALEIQKAAASSSQMNLPQMFELFKSLQPAPVQSSAPEWMQPLIAAAIPALVGLFTNVLTPKNPLTEFSSIITGMNEVKGLLGPGSPAPKVDYIAEAIRNGPGLLRSATELLAELNRAAQVKAQQEAILAEQRPRVIQATPSAHTPPAVVVMPSTTAPVPPVVTDTQIAAGAPTPQWVLSRAQQMITSGQNAAFVLDWIEEQGVTVEIPRELVLLRVTEMIEANDKPAEIIEVIQSYAPDLMMILRQMPTDILRTQIGETNILNRVVKLPHFESFLAAFHSELQKPSGGQHLPN